MFENLTEKMDLESRYTTAVRVQGETLDNLAEGVAVFGPDGRIRLSNPAFTALWRLSADIVAQKARISRTIRARCEPLAEGQSLGRASSPPSPASTTSGATVTARPSCVDGTVLRYAVIHLPNGQVMMTFVDVTDSVNIERALKEKNEALEKADQLKNDFVQHVSYELRSPLTNIIGFTELLSLPTTGPLSRRAARICRAYRLVVVGAARPSSTTFSTSPPSTPASWSSTSPRSDVDQTIAAAVELVADRLHEHSIALTRRDVARARDLPRRRDPHPPDPLQSAEQRRELRAGRQHDHARLPASGDRRRILGA